MSIQQPFKYLQSKEKNISMQRNRIGGGIANSRQTGMGNNAAGNGDGRSQRANDGSKNAFN